MDFLNPSETTMSDRQYAVLLELFHEYNEVFQGLAEPVRDAFYERLLKKH